MYYTDQIVSIVLPILDGILHDRSNKLAPSIGLMMNPHHSTQEGDELV